MYALFFKKIRPYKKLKKEAERVAAEISSSTPEQAEVQLSVQRTADPSRPFQVSMMVRGLRRPLVISKVGNGVFHLLKLVEKTAFRELNRLKDQRVSIKRSYIPRQKQQRKFAAVAATGEGTPQYLSPFA